ncbi:M15 family metallopeptidase [Paenibacillus spongiae]|uniref:M15 family metallopeptidase n=1 Tax=Paenibacillus spongiae TaxID=2909671 RepID=A0ABY5S3U1_9BACL|nr:M15 family metallopeptidase [Paenibacillus spongiae]UVI28569.1 M15 family metallopeptidase [Paenibacillus spongiae]
MDKTRRMLIVGLAALTVGTTACGGSADKPADHEGQQNGSAQDRNKPNPAKTKAVPTGEGEGSAGDASIQVFVNKRYELAEDYAPTDLVDVEVPTVLRNPEVNQLREEAAEALKLMFGKAGEAGYKLYARSGYRSYKTQEALFDRYAAREGETAASRFSARAGQSEHQTGLAMDITSDSVDLQLSENFGETPEGRWVSGNAHNFGFIIRYPKDKEEITGYMYEPWHLRYLGADMAAKVYESGLTLEEYRNAGDAS